MRKYYDLQAGRVVETTEQDAPILVVVNPDDNEKGYLIECFSLDEHTLNSALDPDELARIEFEPEHAAVIVKRPRNYSSTDEFLFRVSSMGLFLFKDRLVVVVPDIDPLTGGKPLVAIQSLTDVLLRIINRCTVHFLEHLKVINMVSDELEDKINESMENRYLINLFSLEKSLVYYLNAIHTNGVLISKLKNNMARIGIGIEQSELLDDISVENDQCYKLAEIYSNVLSGLMDARVSVVSNNLNVLMKTLNIITIGLMVPTLVVSIFSMNVPIPFQQSALSFWAIITLGFVLAGSIMLWWRHKKFW